MIVDLISRIVCRVTGRCSIEHTSSSDLKHQMHERGRQVDATTTEIRRRRRELTTGDFLENELFIQSKRDES